MTQEARQQTPQKTLFPHDDIIGISHLSKRDITDILDIADDHLMHLRRGTVRDLLKGKVIINLFLENSTRTRMSFEMAAKRLGAEIINMTADGSSLKKGESFDDTLKTLNAIRPDTLVIRQDTVGAAQLAADIMDCPIINGGDGTNEHPTQALLDALTLRRHFGTLDGLRVAICGDILHSRVAHSNALLLRKMGVDVVFAGPKELMPADLANALTTLEDALKDADAVMALRIQKERLQQKLSFTEQDYFNKYGLTGERMKMAKEKAVILHPGPLNRGVEIDSDLADSRQSLITTQVEMGVAVRMACLELLIHHRR